MVYQCGIIFGFLAIGELIVWLTGIKLPSSIIGMLLLTACLQLKWIRLRWVEGIANFWSRILDSSLFRQAWRLCSTSMS